MDKALAFLVLGFGGAVSLALSMVAKAYGL